MPVLRIRDEPKCKICQSEQRDAIDALLELRANRGKDDAGRTVNEQYVRDRMAEWGIPNPTRENVVVHWKKHCQLVDAATVGIFDGTEIDALVRDHLGDDWGTRLINVPEFLPLMLTYLSREIILKMRNGQPLGALVEQYQKLAAESGRRKADESVAGLLAMAGLAAEETTDEEDEDGQAGL